MNAVYVMGSIVTVGLFCYLAVALLKPEWFE